ncbi:SH3 domain-containing protein [Clostridium perfringens]|uniref:SH3 domain-containing protein n=2 Tax=Clostridium perfringens TaxID=1502 RepID=UPI0018E456C6|nr:SH3 domain-containing protein [Clostridium perfringens]MBI5978607.1 SH3 domain-containing protein [Clostridium perfringens]MBI5981523.1 SH3 domain-containing protein [Clostridium perfringens]MBI5989986.1 SH3 domain-containing protein [Clostridium perfringens]MBI6072383.1 SH3 domain-containing protein [Clostridium perfringens]MBI6077933.1 SH3 domain-containing protein [Clostridium perfringens]
MANNIIPNVSSGDLVGSTPTFPPNAVVRGDFLYLRDVDGNQIPGRTVSDGDEITVLFISNEKNIVLVQYPTSSGYRQGYVTNATSIIKYKDDYSWVNGSTPEPVYDFDKTTQIGTLDPRERAVVLYKVDGMTYVAYDTGKGKLTKSGLVHYEGSGSSTGGGSFNGVAPGEVVPGGFTYDNNAQVVGDELYLRDRNGNIIPGRSVSDGDNITVLDVSYSKQLALVQYPAGKVVRQGYVTNATNLIRYFKQGEWLNGSTTEPVLDENGGSLGSLSPYEAATPLYKKNGMIHVVYDTSKGPNTKSGYVKFEGLAQLPDTSIQIPSVSHSQATVEVYGTSGKGRPLKVYKIGNGSKVLFAGFAIHGWEDRWDNDGLALVNIANSLISKIGDYKAQNGLHGWTVYIAPCMNPDGVIVRGTNNGPGRCAVKSRIDMNRCFPRGFKAQYNSRNYTGPNPLGAQEAVALKEFIEKINRTADELVVIDGHGWLGCTYGDSSIAQYFTKQFGFSHNGPSGGGYFSYWAQGLPRTRGLLLEYPDTYSYGEVISRNYIGKTFNAIINILKNNPNGGSVDSGNSGNGGSTSSEGSSSSADISYTATGEVINVQSFLNVRKGPGTNYDSIGQLHQGDKVSIVAKNGEWYKISSPIVGYVNSDYIIVLHDDTSVKLEEWQEECIKFGWGPITKEKYLEYMDSTKLYKNIENDISEAIKDKRLINIINPLNLNKSEMIACAQIVFNNETTTFFRDEWYSKSNPNFIVKYKKLSNGQIIAVERINIKKPEKLVTKLPKAAKGAFKDTIKFEFFKGVDRWFTVASGAIAIGTDLSVFQSNGELKSNEDIAKALAAAVIVNGVETMFCAFLGGIIAQCIAPEFPIVAAVAGAAVSAIAAILIGSFVDNHEKEKYLMNSFKGLIDYLF